MKFSILSLASLVVASHSSWSSTPGSGSSRGVGVVLGFTPVSVVQPRRQQRRRRFQQFESSTAPISSSSTDDSSTATTTTPNNNSEQDQDWWKSVTFEYASIAEDTRSEFPILFQTINNDQDEKNKKPLIYLDSAATSQKPNFVLDALTKYYETSNSNVHRGAHALSRRATEQYEHARDVCAKFVNAYSRNEIVFTSGATEALNLIAYSYGRSHLQEGDEIILTTMEHHSNFVPWQILAQEKKLKLKYIHVDPQTGMMDLNQLQQSLSAKTKIVTFQHVSNVMACIQPVKDIVQMIRSSPATEECKIVLDACQSVPHMPVNVQELGVDFVAASGHKACGPTGIGFLWSTEEMLNSMPPFLGGGEMIDMVSVEGSTYAPAPARFEAGTPAIAQAIGMGAALEYLMKIGVDRIEAYEHELSEYLYKRLVAIPGVTVMGPTDVTQRAALCSFVCDNAHATDLST
mmetsp:Transcript_1299/g.1790  ORF Transcript_1299/g.1790 Transcript_1299/m.1790 type:complete len:461 (-) Transcript_1299:169-1551(-)